MLAYALAKVDDKELFRDGTAAVMSTLGRVGEVDGNGDVEVDGGGVGEDKLMLGTVEAAEAPALPSRALTVMTDLSWSRELIFWIYSIRAYFLASRSF